MNLLTMCIAVAAVACSVSSCSPGPPPTLAHLAWMKGEGYPQHFFPLGQDFDGDGLSDLLVHKRGSPEGLIQVFGIVNGALLSEATWPIDVRGKLGSATVVFDARGPLASTATLAVVRRQGVDGLFECYDVKSGTRVWQLVCPGAEIVTKCGIEDVDGDGVRDLAAVLRFGQASKGKCEQALWIVSGRDGTHQKSIPLPDGEVGTSCGVCQLGGAEKQVAVSVPGPRFEDGVLLVFDTGAGQLLSESGLASTWQDWTTTRVSNGVGGRLWSLGTNRLGEEVLLVAGNSALFSLTREGGASGVVRGPPDLVEPLWDIDGDGVSEYLVLVGGSVLEGVSAPGRSSSVGPAVRLYSGADCRLMAVLLQEMSASVGIVGDLDGRGTPDIYLGSSKGGFILNGEDLAGL